MSREKRIGFLAAADLWENGDKNVDNVENVDNSDGGNCGAGAEKGEKRGIRGNRDENRREDYVNG